MTDVLMAREAGMASALVLTGATKPEALDGAAVIPDYVLAGIAEVLPATDSRTRRQPMIEFIFMLTHNDQTVPDALDVYGTLRDTDLRYVGFKDIGLPPARLRELADAIRADGREVFLEVVSERAEDELRSVTAALDIGVDWLLGGTHPDEALAVLDRVGPPGTPGRPRYCPFPGRVVGHPSILEGTHRRDRRERRRGSPRATASTGSISWPTDGRATCPRSCGPW